MKYTVHSNLFPFLPTFEIKYFNTVRLLIYTIFVLLLFGCSNSPQSSVAVNSYLDTSAFPVEWKQTSGPVFWLENESFFESINSIVSIDSNIFAGTGMGVYRSANKGGNWELVNNGLKNTDVMCLTAMGKHLFAGTLGYQGGIYLSADNGANWQPVFIRNDNTYIHSLSAIGAHLYAEISGNTSTDDGFYISSDFGKSWSKIHESLNFTTEVIATDGDKLFAGKYSGLATSADNGKTWNQIDSGFFSQNSLTIRSLFFVGSTLYAGTNNGVFISANKGANWQALTKESNLLNVKSLLVSRSKLMASTSAGVFAWEEKTQKWKAINDGLKNFSISAMALVANDLFIANNYGISKLSDSMTSWETVNNGLGNTCVFSLLTHNDKLYAGTNGGIFVSNDKGLSWNKVDSIFNSDVRSLSFVGNDLIAGTEHGVIHYSKNRPIQTLLTTYKGVGMNNLTMSLAVSQGEVFAGSFGSGLFKSQNKGKSWKACNKGMVDTYIQCLKVEGNNLFAGTDGDLYLSQDQGENWHQIFDTTQLKKVVLMHCNNSKKVNIQAIAISDTNWFIGTRGCGIFRSTNFGKTWIPVNYGLIDPVIEAMTINQNNLVVSTQKGLYISKNNGASWRSINTGLGRDYLIYSLAFVGNKLYAGTSSGGVFVCSISD